MSPQRPQVPSRTRRQLKIRRRILVSTVVLFVVAAAFLAGLAVKHQREQQADQQPTKEDNSSQHVVRAELGKHQVPKPCSLLDPNALKRIYGVNLRLNTKAINSFTPDYPKAFEQFCQYTGGNVTVTVRTSRNILSQHNGVMVDMMDKAQREGQQTDFIDIDNEDLEVTEAAQLNTDGTDVALRVDNMLARLTVKNSTPDQTSNLLHDIATRLKSLKQ
jgi:hypothetical protein